MEMVLNCFLNSAEPIKIYKVLVGAFVGNVGTAVGKCQCHKLPYMKFSLLAVTDCPRCNTKGSLRKIL